ncbi:hypothetical protein [Tengunoibacter tsumagoiensis]|uniref:Uncharacterized protein n=1 Tax=Tengunoibacter tsumagoiensis TaxID=2014871 RepID=A0A401ZVF5_9CHLR|nr:hypothetical protein [Tengunoibacter tsumagoiensis]GCE10873.1 hypothetical protein KTT_07320 [Tengunoibacter tsumagoiensis]
MVDSTGQNKDKSEPNPATAGFRPLSRSEHRSNWLHEYSEQDIALQAWIRLVELQGIEIEVMLQISGLLVFGIMVSTQAYAQFYIDLHEEMYRQEDPATANFLQEYYSALIPPPDQPEIGPEGLPTMYRYIHLRDVTIMSSGHKVKLPYWRGKAATVDGFVVGASASE